MSHSNGSDPLTTFSGLSVPETVTSTTIRVLGIDPGLSGAICADEGNGWMFTWATPVVYVKPNSKQRRYDIPAMCALIQQATPALAAGLEVQGPRPKEGVKSSFTSGFGYGVWYALLVAYGIPVVTVRPQEWKKRWGLIKSTKQASVLVAKERYPQFGMAKVPMTEGQAEALLIAGYVAERVRVPEKAGE